MKYWLFVNNRIVGPLSINEIIKKDYFNERLLVCPASLSGVEPSNWYFVKDLPEFENYVKTAVSVKEYVDDIFDVSAKSEDNYNIEEKTYSFADYDDIVFENKVLKERLGIKEKEMEEYRNKINYLENKIFEIQKTLKKTQDIINSYESKLKEKDREIERLYKEISQKQEKQSEAGIENKAPVYKDDSVKDKGEEIKSLQKEVEESKNKQPEIELLTESKPETSLKTSDNLTSSIETEKNELAELNLNEENKIEFEIPKFEDISDAVSDDIGKENAVEETNDIAVAEEKNENAELNESSINLSGSTNEVLGVQLVDSNQVEVEKTDSSVVDEQESITSDTEISVDNSENDFGVNLSAEGETSYKKLKSVEINESLIEEPVSFEAHEIDENIETHELKSSKIEGGTLPFQVAEINLDTVESKNLDKADINLEPVKSDVQDVNVKPENSKTSELSLNEEKIQEDKVEFESVQETVAKDELKEESKVKEEKENISVIEKKEKTQLPETEENKVIEEVKKQEKVESDDVITQTNNLSPENIIDKKISFKKEIKEDVFKEEPSKKPETLKKVDNKKKKIKISFKPLVKVFAAVLFIGIFIYSILYILNSGSKDNKNVAINVKYSFKKQEAKQSAVSEKTSDVDFSTPAVSENMSISQISINVKKAIDIVKNYKLGEGKGTVEKWLSNSYTVGREVKEEWSATLLTGSIFVVQYKVLRYKKEPIVYLFEVDVNKNKITRGINNNAIKLISGLNNKKTAKISPRKYKLISQNIESDEEMF